MDIFIAFKFLGYVWKTTIYTEAWYAIDTQKEILEWAFTHANIFK